MNKLLFQLVKVIAIPFWAFQTIKRHRAVRLLIFGLIAGVGLIYGLWGSDGVATAVQLLLQLAYGFGFMILQFVGLFWFISRTKATEIHPGDPKAITWDDYWGNDHIVSAVRQWNQLLTDRGQFQEMGGRSINGILLVGPPGTGKTLLAKALAGSGGTAFYGMEGSGFRAMFWGVDVMKVMGFFRKCRSLAKAYGSCIGFLDEIDAIGMSRGGIAGQGQVQVAPRGMMGMGGSGALTRLLYEMDGIEDVSLLDQCQNRIRKWLGLPIIDQGKVMILGSTNRPDVLDPALTRPGRFDRTIHVDLPDRTSRRAIINGYLEQVQHDDTVDIEAIAQDTTWASPAAIMSAITKDAVRLALFDNRSLVSQRDIEDAFQEQRMGLPNPIIDLEPKQRRQIAIHEAGHAIAQHYLRPDLRIVRVSIVRRADALGYVLPASKTDIYTMPLEIYTRGIIVSMAGHVATEVMLGEPWTGAWADIAHIRSRVMILANYGFFGTLPLNQDALQDKELKERIDGYLRECMEKTREFLTIHRLELGALAAALIEREDLTGAEAIEIIEEANHEIST
jgi:cell division protease FtsH